MIGLCVILTAPLDYTERPFAKSELGKRSEVVVFNFTGWGKIRGVRDTKISSEQPRSDARDVIICSENYIIS
jgi:hypothetical protein